MPAANGLATTRAVTLWIRILGAGLLVAAGWIHLYLYNGGYSGISLIGPLFLAHAVVAGIGALALLLAPAQWLSWVCLAGALFEAGSLGGLVLSLTVGLFGFVESLDAPLVGTTIAVEAAGFVLLVGYGAFVARPWSRHRDL